jgi:hypothetical protein
MRLRKSVVVFFLFLMHLLKGQEPVMLKNITLPDSMVTVQQALQIISRQTGLGFSYNPAIIDLSGTIQFMSAEEQLDKALSRILGDSTLRYRIIGKQIVIYRPVELNRSEIIDTGENSGSVSMVTIRGRVIDKRDRQPVPFANVCLVGKSVGTVVNQQGYFMLKLDADHIGDTLGISCMGYERLVYPVSEIADAEIDFYLQDDIIPIQEVIIRKTNPLSLLRSAIENIPVNYPDYPVLLTSFYREIVSKSGEVRSVSEAILQTYKAGYQNQVSGTDQIRIIRGRQTKDISNTDSLILKLKAGLNTTLLLDVVKNLPEFLLEENFGEYIYKMRDIIIHDKNDLYVIQFSPREGYPDALYRGRIFLDIRTLAFTALEFEVDPMKIEKAGDRFILKKPRYLRVKPQLARYYIAYREIEKKYYLNLVRCETIFRIRHKNRLFGVDYSTRLEMAVTRADNEGVDRFRIRETARAQEIFMEQIEEYSDSYWGEYNFIKPEDPLEEAIQRIGGEKEEAGGKR